MLIRLLATLAVTLLWVLPAFAQWTYKTYSDPMGAAPVRVASIRSLNFHQLPFPYSGKTFAHLALRYREGGDIDVLVGVDQGQILCRSDCETRVRFDDDAAEGFDSAGPTDYSSDTVFLRSEESFVERILKSKRVRVELLMYQAGSRVFEFSVRGVRWPPPLTQLTPR
jgi:hypothetical protein